MPRSNKVYYVAFGDVHPCHYVDCSFIAKHMVRIMEHVYDSDVPTYEDEQCSEYAITFQNPPILEFESCNQGRRITSQRPVSCEGASGE